MSSNRIEIKTKSLFEINQKCKSNGWDIKKVFVETEFWEDIARPDELYVKVMSIRNSWKNIDECMACVQNVEQGVTHLLWLDMF